MAALDALRAQLADVEAELAGLGDRRKALQRAASDLSSAISSVEALGDESSTQRPAAPARQRTSPKPKSKRPTITPEALVAALGDLGGTATVEALVEKLALTDGRSLNGARRVAVDAGMVTYEDRTYALVTSDSRAR